MSEGTCECDSCGAIVDVVDFNSGGHKCPWFVAPVKGEPFADYQRRYDAAKKAWLAENASECVVEEIPLDCPACGEVHTNESLERSGGRCPKVTVKRPYRYRALPCDYEGGSRS